MLFKPYPKTRREDLFDREEELGLLKACLERGERLIVITGIRRVGKTSFLYVALRAFGYPHVVIDVREIYDVHRRVSRYDLYRKIAEFFSHNLGLLEKAGFRMKELIGRIKGFRVSELGVEIEPTGLPDITRLLRYFDEWAKRNGSRFIVAFDEAQYLRFSGATRYDGVFAWAADNLENLTLILTGSEAGLLGDFLGIDDPRAPLYGRYIRWITLSRFTRRQSLSFLRQGFEELRVAVSDDELEEVVDNVDGIPGWLTLYGYCRGVEKREHREALSELINKGSRMALSELDKIISASRERYLAILTAIARGLRSWKDIRDYLILKTGHITDARFTYLLNRLMKYSIIEKKDNEYRIIDPLLEHAIKTLHRQRQAPTS